VTFPPKQGPPGIDGKDGTPGTPGMKVGLWVLVGLGIEDHQGPSLLRALSPISLILEVLESWPPQCVSGHPSLPLDMFPT
jgi:hypothetical protein